MAVFKIPKGDRLPALTMTLKDPAGAAVDLSSAAGLRFLAYRRGELVIDGTPTTVDAAAGLIKYEWGSGETDVEGSYRFEVEVEWSAGIKQTFPTVGPLDFIVRGDLG